MSCTLMEYYVQRYLPLRLIGCRSGTREQYDIALHHWGSYADILPIGKINSLILAEFTRLLCVGRQPSTVNKTLRHLRAILRFARREHAIRHMPEIPHLREPRRTPIAFLTEEFTAILRSTTGLSGNYNGVPRGPWWWAFLLVDWDTGLRGVALLMTLTADVRLDGTPGIYIRPEVQKNWTGRWYAIHPETVEAIQRIYNPKRRQLWPWPYGIKVLPKHFRKLCQSAGVVCGKGAGCLLHRIRKSTCSYYEAAGGNGQQLLGHSHPSVTAHYRDPRIVGPHDAASKMPHGF
jgi:integrase